MTTATPEVSLDPYRGERAYNTFDQELFGRAVFHVEIGLPSSSPCATIDGMRTRRGKTVAMGVGITGFVVLVVAGVALKDRIREEYWIWRLERSFHLARDVLMKDPEAFDLQAAEEAFDEAVSELIQMRSHRFALTVASFGGVSANDPEFHEHAIWRLCEDGFPDDDDYLKGLEDTDPAVRLIACRWFGKRGALLDTDMDIHRKERERISRALTERLRREKDSRVRQAIAEALENIQAVSDDRAE